MQIGILKCTIDPLVAVVPKVAAKLIKDGYNVVLEEGAGEAAFFMDDNFKSTGVQIAKRIDVIRNSDILLTASGIDDDVLSQSKEGAILIGKFNSFDGSLTDKFKDSSLRVFSLDRVPRSSIAQSMDVLSSLASLSGYMAVIIAAERYPGYLPMMTTAAGTVPPAKVLILGAGVAGLQAIATARRLGAVVEVFDVRSAVKEEVQSLGAKFIEVDGAKEDKGAGGYAVEQTEEYIQKQKELIHDRAQKSDIIITTANIPGKKAPLLIEERTVRAMAPGSVIIDMASATGGNCALSKDNATVLENQVKILGNSKLFNLMAKEASSLFANNLYNFLKFIVKDGEVSFEHEIATNTYFGKPANTAA